jgi:hypothetical protein
MANESLFLNDLRGCSFEEWVAFAFDRPVPAGKEPNWWHLHEDDEEMFLIVEPTLQIQHGRRLFADPLFLLDRFTAAQLEQGFWFVSWCGNIHVVGPARAIRYQGARRVDRSSQRSRPGASTAGNGGDARAHPAARATPLSGGSAARSHHVATPQERAALIDPFLQLPRDEKLLAYARACRAGRAQ